MKKLLFVLTLCVQGLYGAAAAKPFDVVLRNETNIEVGVLAGIDYLDAQNKKHYWPIYFGDMNRDEIYPQKVNKILKIFGRATGSGSSVIQDSDYLIISDQQNEQLRSGNYYIAIVKESPNKLGVKIRPKQGQEQVQEEGKQSASSEEEIPQLKRQLAQMQAQLAKMQTDLTARITQLESEVRSLKQEQQPGS